MRVRRSDGLFRRVWNWPVFSLADWPKTVDLPSMWTKNLDEAAVYDEDGAIAMCRALSRHAPPGVRYSAEPA